MEMCSKSWPRSFSTPRKKTDTLAMVENPVVSWGTASDEMFYEGCSGCSSDDQSSLGYGSGRSLAYDEFCDHTKDSDDRVTRSGKRDTSVESFYDLEKVNIYDLDEGYFHSEGRGGDIDFDGFFGSVSTLDIDHVEPTDALCPRTSVVGPASPSSSSFTTGLWKQMRSFDFDKCRRSGRGGSFDLSVLANDLVSDANDDFDRGRLQSIPEEHVYEEIRNDRPDVDLSRILPPPLPPRNPPRRSWFPGNVPVVSASASSSCIPRLNAGSSVVNLRPRRPNLSYRRRRIVSYV